MEIPLTIIIISQKGQKDNVIKPFPKESEDIHNTMKKVFVSDGNIYVKDDEKQKSKNEKALHDKIQSLESKVDELLKESSPEERERQKLMERLGKIRHR